MIALEQLPAAVADALSSKYCPVNKSDFLLKLGLVTAAFCAAAIALLLVRTRSSDGTRRFIAGTCAAVALLFAAGGASWDLFGLSGCGSHATAGVIWVWPW